MCGAVVQPLERSVLRRAMVHLDACTIDVAARIKNERSFSLAVLD
ncbi:hypothetical protein SLEP1_g27794 [Rubroshorea leprosula]|uniref:Uncharacterized protein n=1 Tax=Rubroshorea leprosula TaxID=152421 RepID=A0AAV5JXK3_9ROSI|nr:hypothetical protein SLEP1_g27794 [Rubroshorea leprosula]